MRAVLMAGVAVVGLGVGTARADVVFSFSGASSTPIPITFAGNLIVDQAVADAGFNFTSQIRNGTFSIRPAVPLFEAGLHGIFLQERLGGYGGRDFSLGNFVTERGPGSGENYELFLSGSTATGLFGSLRADDDVFEVRAIFNGLTGAGIGLLDADGNTYCGSLTGLTACTFTTALTVTQNVPEPTTMTLLGVGVLGLAASRRRTHQNPSRE